VTKPRHLPLRLLALTAVAAATDAVSYLGLGHVFPANMTGNTVLLALGAASGDGSRVARSAVALAGFVCGATAAGATTRRGTWDSATRRSLTGEGLVLVLAALWWSAQGARPVGAGRYALIALLGLAMGTQSAAITRLGAGVSTTYITGTWTRVSAALGRRLSGRRRESGDEPLRVEVLACYVMAAFAAAVTFHYLA
jgi:uncharacterized membrane protein YoaK (UPF0700 family)